VNNVKNVSTENSVIIGSNSDAPTTYLKWRKGTDDESWDMQTKVTTFERGDQTVELHAQLHFGDESYFQYWNSNDKFNNKFDRVLFELLIDEDLLEFDERMGYWQVKEQIMASPNDQALAAQYGWKCQASTLDYTHVKWVHADLSRQEFVKLSKKNDNGSDGGLPLWKLASPESSSAAAEAVAALTIGPPTLSYSTRILNRRLFTNLFLPGSTFAFALRTVLWFTIPAPELSILLLDWSSLMQGGSNPNALSQVALPILKSLLKFDIPQMRRFLFGQILVASSNNGPDHPRKNKQQQASPWSLLVTERNDHAMKVLQKTLEDDRSVKSVALLYGSSHCPDLHKKIVSMGFRPMKAEWRTAWSVRKTENVTSSSISRTEENSALFPALAGFLLFYLTIGALDWVDYVRTLANDISASNHADAGLEGGLYLLRHVLLYLGLSKFVIDWKKTDMA
jgi:hypothetical protein